jgi:hypothetical protein
LNEGIKLRERRREREKERSSHRNYLHMSGCLGHVPQAPKASIVTKRKVIPIEDYKKLRRISVLLRYVFDLEKYDTLREGLKVTCNRVRDFSFDSVRVKIS